MLQIRLSNKGSASEGTGGGKNSSVETVTVACPDHLVLADLPVAKSIGTASTATLVKIVGRRSRRHLGERVHFCVRCDFPIAIYGRLSPCEHAFCLDCARSDSSCYLCDERIQKIQTIKMMEGIYICAAPHCLKSFLKKPDFEAHIHQTHADLLQPNIDKEDGNESDATFKPTSTEAHTKQSIAPDISTARTPLPRAGSGFSPSSTSQAQIREPPKPSPPQHKQPPPQLQPGFYARHPNYPPEQHRFPFSDYPPQPLQPPNYVVPVNSISPQAPVAYNILPFQSDIGPGPGPGPGQEQGSLLGFPPAPMTGGFSDGYPRPPWTGVPFEPMQVSQGNSESYGSQGGPIYFQGMLPNPDNKDGKGVLAAQPRPPPPPPQQRQLLQFRGGNFTQMGDSGQSYGWQHEKQDGGYGGGQE